MIIKYGEHNAFNPRDIVSITRGTVKDYPEEVMKIRLRNGKLVIDLDATKQDTIQFIRDWELAMEKVEDKK